MINENAEYYLHTNGFVIYKPWGIEDAESDFIVKIWNAKIIGQSPVTFLEFLREALKLGADPRRILELYNHNNLDNFLPANVTKVVKDKINEFIKVEK